VADFARVMTKDLGFRPDHLIAFSVSLPDVRYPADGRIDFIDRVLERLRGTPAVTSAAARCRCRLPATG
jgi:hypothetical protein